MKPADWDELDLEAKKAIAHQLFRSMRGQYIIGQALAIARESLLSVEPDYLREVSNAEDMEILSVLFFPYAEVKKAATIKI